MGSKSSKIASSSAAAARTSSRRQYPQRVPSHAQSRPSEASSPSDLPPPSASSSTSAQPPPATPYPQAQPQSSTPLASSTKSADITHDSSDPHFTASMLRSLGPVQNPASTLSRTSTVSRSSQYPSYDQSSSPSSATAASGNSAATVERRREDLSKGAMSRVNAMERGGGTGAELGGQMPIFPESSTAQAAGRSGNGAAYYPNMQSNIALRILRARERITQEAEAEIMQASGSITAVRQTEGQGPQGRKYMDALTLRRVLWLRDRGNVVEEEIERRLGLRRGLVSSLRGTALPDDGIVDQELRARDTSGVGGRSVQSGKNQTGGATSAKFDKNAQASAAAGGI